MGEFLCREVLPVFLSVVVFSFEVISWVVVELPDDPETGAEGGLFSDGVVLEVEEVRVPVLHSSSAVLDFSACFFFGVNFLLNNCEEFFGFFVLDDGDRSKTRIFKLTFVDEVLLVFRRFTEVLVGQGHFHHRIF